MNKSILISHEIPKQLFPYEGLISDYPYVLGHLLNVDKEYTEFYRAKLKTAQYSILDNSAFELGESIPGADLYQLGEEFKPTHLVLPDKVNDCERTIHNAEEYLKKYRSNNLKYIGVCQGTTFEEIEKCIRYYTTYYNVDIIALPFDLVPDSDYVTVRFRFLNWWYKKMYATEEYKTVKNIKIHLLGCQNPVAYLLYRYSLCPATDMIYSVDTSSPIVNGWSGNKLGEHGLVGEKPKDKLADNLDIKLSDSQLQLIFSNVKTFRKYVTE